MPRGAAASLGDAVYLDIVAHVLRENGFPAGDGELTADGAVRPPGDTGQSQATATGWRFLVRRSGGMSHARAGEHMAAHQRERAGQPGNRQTARQATSPIKPLGTQEFRLLDAMAYSPESHKGQKMYVRGLLIRLPGEQRMTISSLETIAPSCSQLMYSPRHAITFVAIRMYCSRSFAVSAAQSTDSLRRRCGRAFTRRLRLRAARASTRRTARTATATI